MVCLQVHAVLVEPMPAGGKWRSIVACEVLEQTLSDYRTELDNSLHEVRLHCFVQYPSFRL